MKIVSIRSKSNYTKEQREELSSLGEFVEITGRKYHYTDILKDIRDAEILIVSPSGIDEISEEMLNSLSDLKYISLLSVGYDFVDCVAARSKGIPVSNIKGANAESVAEHIWAMILGLAKRVNEFDRDIREYGENDYRKYKGIEIFGKTIGVIGTGDIGSRVARISKAFNMNVLGFNRSKKQVDGFIIVTFEQLLLESDIIVICVPLSEDTINLISDYEIKLMKNNVILINCAREQIVNKNAIINALHLKKVFGYGLETNNMSNVSSHDPYLNTERVIITGHNASNTQEAEALTNEITIKNIRAFLNNKAINIIN